MGDELIGTLTSLVERLVDLAGRDEQLRSGLRALAGVLMTATAEDVAVPADVVERPTGLPQPSSRGEAPVTRVDRPSNGVPEHPRVHLPRPAAPLPELTLGRTRPPEPEPKVEGKHPIARAGSTTDSDLGTTETRCRLKAEGIRWAATRRKRLDEGADFRAEVAPLDRELLDRARALPDCFLWMNTPDFEIPDDPGVLEDAAGCFETVAEGLALMQTLLADAGPGGELFEPALFLLAEAQSMLRVAIEALDGPNDNDQFRVYDWLRGVAAREQIYIARYMRKDDPGDPAMRADLESRLDALSNRFNEQKLRVKRKKSQLSKLRYHSRKISEGTGGEHDWQKVAEAVDEMVAEGLPASSVDIREALLPILDAIPEIEPCPPGFTLALREVDRYIATRPAPPAPESAAPPSPEVAEAAKRLEGKTIVLIGGSRRPEAHDSLKAAFGLQELIWIETREHESIDRFEAHVARPEVALVLLAIRWSSHSFGEVKRFCDRYEKPMVRLPGGYNPNQVAAQILMQVSGQLGA